MLKVYKWIESHHVRPQVTILTIALALMISAVAAAEPVTLSLMSWYNPDGWKAIVDEFHKSHPDIEVKVDIPGGAAELSEKLVTMAAGDVLPDLVHMPGLLEGLDRSAWYRSNQVVDITSWMERDGISVSDFVPDAWKETSLNGRYYGIPWAGSPIGVYGFAYNKEKLAAAGLSNPSPEWTEAEFRQMAVRLTKKGSGDAPPEMYGVGWPHHYRFYVHVWSDGGAMIDDDLNLKLDEPQAIETMQWLADLKNVDQAAALWGKGAAFDKQQAAMAFISTGYAQAVWKDLDFDWDMQILPKGSAGSINEASSHVLAISRGSNHKEAAWTFMKWLLSEEGQKAYATLFNGIPSLLDVVKSPDFLYPEKGISNMLPFVTSEVKRPPSDVKGFNDFLSTSVEAFMRAWNGETSVKSAIEEAVPKLNDILAKAKE